MSISAKDVKELREKTGAGMMNCKKALDECNGDIATAVDYLRKKGLAAAQKKQSRIAAEGAVVTLVQGNKGVLVEINCETDFVSKGDEFQNFTKSIASFALENSMGDLSALQEAKSADVNELTLKCGEKVEIRRLVTTEVSEGILGHYNHGGKIGVLVELNSTATGTEVSQLAKDLAMHVAAADPKFLTSDEIDEAYKQKETEIYTAQLLAEGKPEQMITKIIVGKLNKLEKEVCLLQQPFVKDPDITIEKYIAKIAKKMGNAIVVKGFFKLNLGAGIEKKEDNLAEEVAKMTQE